MNRHRRHKNNLRKRVWAKTRGRCWICHDPVSLKEMSMDHVIPRSKGGAARYENLLPAHKKCNGARGSKDPPPSAVHPLARVKMPSRHHSAPKISTDEAIAAQKQDEERTGP